MSPARRMQHIIVKVVLLIPEPYTFSPKIIHRGGNTEEVLEELCCDIFVNGIFTGKLQRDPQHVEAKHSHPACAIALLKTAAVRERLVAIKHANVIKPQETTLK